MKTAFIIDSTAYLSGKTAHHPDVYRVNLTVNFSDGSLGEDAQDLAAQHIFYERLKTEVSLPTTSQPTPAVYYEVMDDIIAKGYEAVIAIHLSAGISGTYQTSHMALSEYADRIKVFCLNTKAASVVMESLLEQAMDLLDAGLMPEVVFEKLQWVADNSHIYLMVEDLDNLVKGGRLNATGALVGGLLKIRPVLFFDEEGKIVLFEKVRTNKKVYQRWIEIAKERQALFPDGIKISFAHSDALEEIQSMRELFAKELPTIDYHISGLGPVVGAHTGAGSKGCAIIPIAKP